MSIDSFIRWHRFVFRIFSVALRLTKQQNECKLSTNWSAIIFVLFRIYHLLFSVSLTSFHRIVIIMQKQNKYKAKLQNENLGNMKCEFRCSFLPSFCLICSFSSLSLSFIFGSTAYGVRVRQLTHSSVARFAMSSRLEGKKSNYMWQFRYDHLSIHVILTWFIRNTEVENV